MMVRRLPPAAGPGCFNARNFPEILGLSGIPDGRRLADFRSSFRLGGGKANGSFQRQPAEEWREECTQRPAGRRVQPQEDLTHEPGTRAYEKHRIGPMNVQPSSHSVATGTMTVPTDVLEPSGSVQFVVADSFEAAGLDAAEWNRAVERLGGPVYMTWHWLRIWWQFYGQRDSLRIFVFRERENIVGLLPFYVSQLGFGPLSVQVARLVGANIPPKVFDPPWPAGTDGAVWHGP